MLRKTKLAAQIESATKNASSKEFREYGNDNGQKCRRYERKESYGAKAGSRFTKKNSSTFVLIFLRCTCMVRYKLNISQPLPAALWQLCAGRATRKMKRNAGAQHVEKLLS